MFEHFSSRAKYTLGDRFALTPENFEGQIFLTKNKMFFWTVETVQKMLNNKQ